VRLLFATTNRHKVAEAAAILAPLGIALDRAERLPPVVEDGDTFAANALAKARSAARALGRAALAEDSGLVVPALGGDPGVRSARYAGESATDAENNARLLRELTARGLVDPAAAFVCHAVVCGPDGRVAAEAEGRVEGVVRGPARGERGFGYDPLFHWSGPGSPPGGVRFAELSPDRKHLVSHRGAALRLLARSLLALPPADAAALAGG
jgi:XTP/dITP diphosphohydrolase